MKSLPFNLPFIAHKIIPIKNEVEKLIWKGLAKRGINMIKNLTRLSDEYDLKKKSHNGINHNPKNTD